MVGSVIGNIGRSILAFFVAVFCGGMVAQILAVSTNAGEEYILVFMATMLVAIIISVPFFISQFFDPSRRAIDRVAIGCVSALVVLLGALAAWVMVQPSQQTGAGDAGIIAGLILPNLTTIGAHWLVVRAMQPRGSATAFGRPQART